MTSCLAKNKEFKFLITIRRGVLEDVLENTFYSPWSQRSSPWPRSLQVLENVLSSARRQHFFYSLKISQGHYLLFTLIRKTAETSAENLQRPFFLRSPGKFFGNLFFFGKHLCLWSLASRESVLEKSVFGLEFFCVFGLGLEGCVPDSTSDDNRL